MAAGDASEPSNRIAASSPGISRGMGLSDEMELGTLLPRPLQVCTTM